MLAKNALWDLSNGKYEAATTPAPALVRHPGKFRGHTPGAPSKQEKDRGSSEPLFSWVGVGETAWRAPTEGSRWRVIAESSAPSCSCSNLPSRH